MPNVVFAKLFWVLLYHRAKINSFSCEDKVVDLYDGLLDLAEERGNNPTTDVGFATTFPEFNRLYGGLRRKNLYIIASRAKSGKTTILNEFASGMSEKHEMEIFYADTEMSTEETRFRAMAAKTGVPLFYIETGNWRKNPEMIQKVRSGLKDIQKKYKVSHYFIGNKKIEEIGAICRRWYLKRVGRGGKCMIVFDYIKMIDKLSHNQTEYAAMGDKVDYLKKLAEELDCPILTAVQSNRAGITMGKEVSDLNDDESSIAISDRILWYSSYVGILRRRVAEEIILDTPESGSHKLVTICSRHGGKDSPGHMDMLLRTFPDGKRKYINNFINFDIQNFKVEEKGSARDSIARQNAQFLVSDPQNPASPEETL